jgi:hypothetical protein
MVTSRGLWRALILALVVAAPLCVWLFSRSLALALVCNKKNFSGNQSPCDSMFPDQAYCFYWDVDSCNGQQGAAGARPNKTERFGPPWYFGCTEPTSNPVAHCVIKTENCLESYICDWWTAMGYCRALTPLGTYIQWNRAVSESCTPAS